MHQSWPHMGARSMNDELTVEKVARELAETNIRTEDDWCRLVDWIPDLFLDDHPTMAERMEAALMADKAIVALARAAIQAHLAALQEAEMVVVPKEPTLEMMVAAEKNIVAQYRESDWDYAKDVAECLVVRDTYRAMLTAHTNKE